MSNHDKGEIKDIPQEHIDAAKKGAAGGLGLVGGAIGGVAKGVVKMAGGFANTAKQYLNLAKGGKAAKKTSNFRPLITGNKVYNRKMINDAFKSRFGEARARHDAAKALKTKPQNVISNATVDRASKMRNIERGYIGNTPRWAKPAKK